MRSPNRFIWSAVVSLLLAWVPSAFAQPEPMRLPALLKAKPIAPAATDDELQKLLKERYNAALAETQSILAQIEAGVGRVGIAPVADVTKRLVFAALEVKKSDAEKIAFLELHVEVAKEVEGQANALFKAGAIQPVQYYQARYYRLDAEIMLLRAKRAAANPKGK